MSSPAQSAALRLMSNADAVLLTKMPAGTLFSNFYSTMPGQMPMKMSSISDLMNKEVSTNALSIQLLQPK